MFTDAPEEYFQIIHENSIQEKNLNQMLMKILVFHVEKCSKMEKTILPKFTAKE